MVSPERRDWHAIVPADQVEPKVRLSWELGPNKRAQPCRRLRHKVCRNLPREMRSIPSHKISAMLISASIVELPIYEVMKTFGRRR